MLFCLQKQRQKLTEKIEQLNLAIDDVSTQLRSEDNPNGAAVNSDGIEEALIWEVVRLGYYELNPLLCVKGENLQN